MAIEMKFEALGQIALARGQTVNIGWELFEGEFPPLVNHSNIVGFDDGRHKVQLGPMEHESKSVNGIHSFRYNVTNTSTGPAVIHLPQSYIFFTVR